MGREITTRVWDKNSGQMFYNAYMLSDRGHVNFGFGFYDDEEMETVEVMLCSDIYDKGHNKKIFENDVVEFCYEGILVKAVVKFEAGAFILGFIGEHKNLDDGYVYLHDYIESWDSDILFTGILKGNIFENPELNS